MQKTILITGATDGIGLATAKLLAQSGHRLLLHGRNPQKLKDAQSALEQESHPPHNIQSYIADLSHMDEVKELAERIASEHSTLDVLINNAGIFKTPHTRTPEGMDIRFVVNALAPYMLTQKLLPLFGQAGRIINLSSAAQAPVNLDALNKHAAQNLQLEDMDAYAQSKLALTMWSHALGTSLQDTGPCVVAVNPGSLLATKMVQEAFGNSRGGVEIGAEILCRAALSDTFKDASGKYFDNDAGHFAQPHPDALVPHIRQEVVAALQALVA